MSSSTPNTTSSQHSNVVPSEVGWQFVPQYYTFVNKEPHRLHCFYNKNSTFIHGTEGEDMKPCFGQQEIHNKITSIGFEDCKVFIHSVDAQSSANGGIIIQVIGEMSNHADPWRKFVQTFFLAEQPNGYFVLNDIFRFLKEETVEGDDLSETAEGAEAAPEPAALTQPAAAPEPVHEPAREPTPPPVAAIEPTPAEPAPVEEATPAEVIAEPPIIQTPTPAPEEQQPQASTPAAQPNGIHTPEPEKAAPVAAAEPSPAPTPAPQQQQPAPASPPAAAAAAPAPAAAPIQPVRPVPAAAAPAPQPAAPAAPRSWASLAASNPKKWGAAVAQESRGTTETLSSPAASAPVAQTSAPAAPPAQRPQGQQQGAQQANGRQDHPAYVAVQSVNTAQCFVKGVTEPVSQTALQTTLSSRFGPIKELEIVRAKACAFIEFQSVESAKRAIIASLTQHQGGEGGIWIDVGGEAGQLRISVETKKERGDRPVSRPRGGAPSAVNGDGRGAPGGGRGRGGGRGGRGGASTPK